jgi:hypothetical protein
MKRRQELSTIKGKDELKAIWSALEGEPGRLVDRLRRGVALSAEQALAADLIEGNLKLRRPRNRQSHLEIAQWVAALKRVFPGRGYTKGIVYEVAVAFQVSERHVYNAMSEFDSDALAEIQRIRKPQAASLSWLDRDTQLQMLEKFVRTVENTARK